MKIGIEVEGRLKGMPTLFCEAADLAKAIDEAKSRGITHIYVSDNQNSLPYSAFDSQQLYFTLDVTKVRKELRPYNLSLMLRLEAYDDVSQLNDNDQIKFERNRMVSVFPMTSAITTSPADFAGDIEI